MHMNANGDKYVKIDDDILQNVAQKEWKNVVKKYMSDNFGEGFELNGQHIKVNKKSKKEYTYSGYTKNLNKRKTKDVYADKMRAVNNLDEIVENTRNIKNEPLKHPRKDSFIAFDRGEIDIEIGGKTYTGEVVIGETNQGGKGIL